MKLHQPDDWQTLRMLDDTEAEAMNDIAAELRQVRRVFRRRRRDRRAENVQDCQQQLAAVVESTFDLLHQTHENYWQAIGEALDKLEARWHQLIAAADVVKS